MALSTFITLICLLSITSAAPSRFAQSLFETSKISVYFDLMENVCSDITIKACAHRDGYMFRYSVYDPVSDWCVCSASPSAYLANKKCAGVTCPADRPVAYYWPHTKGCFCEVPNFFAKPWNYVLPEEEPDDMTPTKSIFKVQHNELLFRSFWETVADGHTDSTGTASDDVEARMTFSKFSAMALSMLKHKMAETIVPSHVVEEDLKVRKRQDNPSAPSTQPAAGTAVPTFIPPPKTDITPALINQSLTVQPQNTAIVGSVIPDLKVGTITYLVQLDGIVASTIPMNASTTFPCGTVGTNPQPNIMLVPKHVQQGARQTIIANCRCIAVNIYDPKVITYWVQNEAGSIFSLVGSNKVFDIDKIDTSAPISLSLTTTPSGATKRQETEATDVVTFPRRQVLKIHCNRPCPKYTDTILGFDGQCGCLVKEAGEALGLAARGLNEPDAFSATMTKEACAAMTCTNNGGKPAMFNPFSLTCWCTDPAYVEDNASAWTGNAVKY